MQKYFILFIYFLFFFHMQVKLQKGKKKQVHKNGCVIMWLFPLHFNEKGASKLKQPAGRQAEQAIVLIK